MAFSIRCQCGKEIPVAAGQAGAEVRCACGRMCLVPLLGLLEAHERAGTVPAAKTSSPPLSSNGLPAPHPVTQVVVLTAGDAMGQRIQQEAFRHFIAAMMCEVEEFVAGLPKGRGMDLRLALALLPDGRKLVDVEVRPDHLGSTLDALRSKLSEMPAPPIQRGPVALLASTLIWGGSDAPDQSFRHPSAPYYRNELPPAFAAALAQAERNAAANGPRTGRPWQQKAKDLAARLLGAWRRFLGREKPAPPPVQNVQQDLAQFLITLALRSGADAVIRDLTERIRLAPDEAELYGLRGDWLQEQGNFDAAVADYTELIALTPDLARAYVVRGTCQRRAGSMEKALADFNEALWRQPTCAEALAERSCIFFELGALDRALTDVEAAIEADADNARLPALRGRMFASKGKLDEALEDFSRSIRLDPHCAEVRFLRGQVYRDRRTRGGQGKEDNVAAIADLTAGLRLDPEHVMGYAFRAETRLMNDDVPGSLADCEEALRRDPKCGLAYAVRGVGRHRQGVHRQAIEDLSVAMEQDIDGLLLRLTRAEAYASEGEWDAALADCNVALEDAPEHAGAYALRARLHAQLGSLEEAMEDAEAAVRLAPGWHLGYGVRGNIHGLQGDHEMAVQDLSEALRLEPQDTMARYNRAVAWCEQGQFDKAIEDFNLCIEHGGSGAPLYFSRANAWLQKGETQKARDDFDEALRQDSEFLPAWFARGNLLMNNNELDAAKSDFDELIRLCPTLAFAYAARANVWTQKGEHQKAEEDFQEAVRLDPGSAEGYTLHRLIVEANFHYRNDEFSRAVALASEALDMDPECAPAYALRGAAYWYWEHQVEAADDFTKLLEVAGDSFAAYCNRGQVLAEMGEFDRALEDLDRALELGKGTEPSANLVHARSGRALVYAGLGRYEEAECDFGLCLKDGAGNAWVHYNRGLMYHGRDDASAATACFRQALECHDPALPPRKRDRARAYLQRAEREGQDAS
jgi:tetratricopeptide (TPR) repeat protein